MPHTSVMPTTAGERVKAAVRKQRTTLAAVAREAQVPAPWLRSFATDHVHRGDPARIKRVADALGLDYRELLALTDQLGAVEVLEHRVSDVSVPYGSDDRLDRLLRAVEVQQGTIETMAGAIERQQQDIAALMDLVRRLLPQGGAQVTPPDPDAPLPNEQAVIERTRDVTGLPLTESRAEAPSGRRAGRGPRAALRGSARP